MRKQIVVDICVPAYANLRIGEFTYSVSVVRNVSESVWNNLRILLCSSCEGIELYSSKGRFYYRWCKSYDHSVPYYKAFKEAERQKNIMMCNIRTVQSQLLWDEAAYYDSLSER